MNAELLYRYLMDAAVLFLSGWLVLLVGAFTVTFAKQQTDLPASDLPHGVE